MSKPKVYVSKFVRPEVLARLGEVSEVQCWTGPDRCPPDVLATEVSDVEAVLGSDRWTPELMDQAPQLRLIALTSAGIDKVDIPASTARGILVTNTPGILTETTADLTFALIMSVARRVTELERWFRAGHWRAVGETPMASDVHHATLGIIGMGRIGAAVAHRARGFHMNVLYHNRSRRPDLEAQYGYKYVDLETLLRQSDFVTVLAPLLPETKKMIGAPQLNMMKPSAFLINASRGPIVDEAALIKALQEKRIAGAGLDVFEKEPVKPDHPLLNMENVVALPHVGSATEATRQAMVDLATDNILAVFRGKEPRTPVNPEVLPKLKKRASA